MKFYRRVSHAFAETERRNQCCNYLSQSPRGILPDEMNNILYLVVLPLIHLDTGKVEQTLTLLPDRTFATEFFPDEVQGYVLMFQARIKYLTGGRVTGYSLTQQDATNGRVVVKVEQYVS
jgi:hypothetical protein